MVEPTKWAMERATELLCRIREVSNFQIQGVFSERERQLIAIREQVALALDEARRQGIARLADPDNGLIWRGMSVAAATGAVLTDVQMHDICQALADELEPTDD